MVSGVSDSSIRERWFESDLLIFFVGSRRLITRVILSFNNKSREKSFSLWQKKCCLHPNAGAKGCKNSEELHRLYNQGADPWGHKTTPSSPPHRCTGLLWPMHALEFRADFVWLWKVPCHVRALPRPWCYLNVWLVDIFYRAMCPSLALPCRAVTASVPRAFSQSYEICSRFIKKIAVITNWAHNHMIFFWLQGEACYSYHQTRFLTFSQRCRIYQCMYPKALLISLLHFSHAKSFCMQLSWKKEPKIHQKSCKSWGSASVLKKRKSEGY